jgi:hypothetical protein
MLLTHALKKNAWMGRPVGSGAGFGMPQSVANRDKCVQRDETAHEA